MLRQIVCVMGLFLFIIPSNSNFVPALKPEYLQEFVSALNGLEYLIFQFEPRQINFKLHCCCALHHM